MAKFEAEFTRQFHQALTSIFQKSDNHSIIYIIQGATDKLFFLSADTDKGRYTQFSYRPIPITYRYTIFHIGRYRNRYRYRISSNISYRNAIKIFFTIKCNLELLH